ncbi:MAG TPA: TadE/TadG family type IV pilus assembly protein [Tepidisphaeraceae bacterium]|nr:TadE/TadG family type IV pilus assembly protein [Tepidisphaeraceae bacterium]
MARRGAAAVELALVLMVLLILIFGTLDVGMLIFRYTVVSQGARQGARQAIVRGAMSTKLTKWGPAAYDGTAAGTDEIAQAIAPFLGGLNLNETNISIRWPNGSNEPERTVRVTVQTTYQPATLFLFGNPTWAVSAVSTMQVTH